MGMGVGLRGVSKGDKSRAKAKGERQERAKRVVNMGTVGRAVEEKTRK